MSLTAAMETARQSLSVISAKTSVVSRNVANQNVPFASRKTANSVTGPGGVGVVMASITRASDDALLRALLSANSDASHQQAVADALDQLDATISDPDLEGSPAAVIGKLADAVQQYATAPGDLVRGQAAISAARDAADALNSATQTVQDLRAQADAGIKSSVDNIKTLLAQFEDANNAIILGTQSGTDITDDLDTRDRVLSDLSKETGIRTISQANNGMAIYTDSGVALFNGTARSVTFDDTLMYDANSTGNAVYIDGQAVTGPAAATPLSSGRIAGYAEIRDETARTYQNQLDEMARGLIEMFAESDQSGGGGADAVGLFTYTSLPATVPPAVPAPGTLGRGLAGQITVDPGYAANPTFLRDGKTYDYNPSDSSGFAVRLNDLYDRFSTARDFDALAQLGTSSSILTFSSYSTGWLEEQRSSVAGSLEYSLAVQERSAGSLSNATGINLDYEMSLLLELEQSYQASSRLITTIENMYAALMAAVG